MNISRFFVDRPIFAAVLFLLLFIGGAIAVWDLPVSEYPEVVPPSVIVTAQYPGRQPKDDCGHRLQVPWSSRSRGSRICFISSSQSTSDGLMTLSVTFKVGTDPDVAQQLVQNRVNQAVAAPARRGAAVRRGRGETFE